MPIAGAITDLSVPEIFRFLEKGQKTGLLSFGALPADQGRPRSVHYFWVEQGRIVAAANRADRKGLVSLIAQQQWLSDRVFAKLLKCCCPPHLPLGICLKNYGVLSAPQLEQLFYIQVLQQVCPLFQIEDGLFKFEQNMAIPGREMTGFSVPATEATLMGLRWLPNWDALSHQLPAPQADLASIIVGEPHQRLDTLELKVLEYSKRPASLYAIAKHLRLPIEKVQQIAFRLIAAGLAAVPEKIHQSNSHHPSSRLETPLLLASV
ncbi:MAG TPA: hypothetical protein DDZ80_25645 [Cyanobacteria bacterium UBA8803]|nr:hypothetical protein [Cyanobacteria bacterium UBA9273]HBL61678.1 hypothetical protein [Cyanobacteria bacterium UBA8803]